MIIKILILILILKLTKMPNSFNPNRLMLARLRRKMTYKLMADKLGMSSKMLSWYEKSNNGHDPTDASIRLISQVLAYPVDFFYGDDIESVDLSTVSFRSLKSMKASQQHAAIAAGQLGVLLSEYLTKTFTLPRHDLPDLRGCNNLENAAETLRESWALGNRGIQNLVHLLESKGVRVFSLAENTADVDAFSFWKDNTPYIFLNTQKSAERSRFDAAHELGHLLLHKHGTPPRGKDVEKEADAFASAFLMPATSIIEYLPKFVTLQSLIKLKKKWSISLVSLVYRLHKLGFITEWQYRTLMIEASQKGYRKKEPDPCGRETSLLFDKVIPALKSRGIGLSSLAKELKLPIEELTNLMFRHSIVASNPSIQSSRKSNVNLKVVSSHIRK